MKIMAIYEYRALERAGKSVKGVVDAFDADSARKKLKVKGIYLESIRERQPGTRRSFLSLSFTRNKTVTARITRQLSFLLGANVPVTGALDGVIDRMDDDAAKSMMIDIKEKVKEGRSVSAAFSDYPDYFNQMYTSTLHAGEVSGKLETVFERLASMYEKNQAFSSKIKSSITYPSLMLVLGVIIILFLVSFIVPTFSRLFSEFGQTLPLPTRALIAISNFITKAWWAVLIFIASAYFVMRRMYRIGRWTKSLDGLVLKLPVTKRILLDSFRIRFSYTMSLMLQNGVPIIDALLHAGGIFKNSIFRKHIENTTERVKKGESLSRALAGGDLFNSSILGMIHAGTAAVAVEPVAAGQPTDATAAPSTAVYQAAGRNLPQ